MGMKNHDLVPRELIIQIAALRHGGAEKMLQTLLRYKLLHHETKGFDGYRLTTLGYDYLALRAFVSKGLISGVGTRIGVGKESDIYLVENEEGETMVLKLHRLGRTSFRKIKRLCCTYPKIPQFSELLKDRICPLVISNFSLKSPFGILLRVIRLISAFINNFVTILVLELLLTPASRN